MEYINQINNFRARTLYYLAAYSSEEEKVEYLTRSLRAFFGNSDTPPADLCFLHALEALVVLSELKHSGATDVNGNAITILSRLRSSWESLENHDQTVELVSGT